MTAPGTVTSIVPRRRAGASTGLTDRVGKRLEVVRTRPGQPAVLQLTQDLPPQRGGEPGGMWLAEVVAVRLGVRRERADDRRRVGVGVGERGDGGRRARDSRAAPEGAHERER